MKKLIMKYYKPCQLKVLSEVNLALCDANECTNSDLWQQHLTFLRNQRLLEC